MKCEESQKIRNQNDESGRRFSLAIYFLAFWLSSPHHLSDSLCSPSTLAGEPAIMGA